MGILLLVAACAAPQRPTLPELYARHPDLEPLDTSPLRGRIILIDPGHGGTYAGTRGVDESTREADVNLGVALYLWGLLRDVGADVHLTRASDRDLLPDTTATLTDDLAARVALIDSLRPGVFLSLHHNSNAELDRERNRIETYYRLDDDGPSYDLARAIHRRLAQHLGIDDARLLPGNYYVLRNADTAAVLGEASYLSHPDVESRLRLAEKQLLEAEAYFLGLLDYFARGIPSISQVEPAGDTLHGGQMLRLRVGEGDGVVDPLATELRLDGVAIAPAYDIATGEVTLVADEALAPGGHEIELRARNLQGNAARLWQRRIVVQTPPTSLFLHQEPDPASPGSDVRLRLRLVDAWGRAVADSLDVEIEAPTLRILQAESATRAGEVIASVRVPEDTNVSLRVRTDSLTLPLALRLVRGVPKRRAVHCLDRRDARPLSDAWVRCGDTLVGRTDRTGGLLVHPGCDTLRIDRVGYVPWIGMRPDAEPVRMAPVLAGHLARHTFLLDPGGEGLEPSAAQLGVSAAELSFEVTRFVESMLAGAGARVHRTRGPTEEVPETERVRAAERNGADWYIRIEATLEPGESAAVLHYPGSSTGEQLARALARWLERRGGADTVSVRSDARYVLQQTACPAVVVQLPGPPSAAARSAWVRVDSLRNWASALFVGLRVGVTPEVEAWPPLEGWVDPALEPDRALVLLDGAVAVRPGSGGHFRFECVPADLHRLTLLHPHGRREIVARTTSDDTTRVRFETQRGER
jgi:N-acetylmuramoyl-L-alanine amidase